MLYYMAYYIDNIYMRMFVWTYAPPRGRASAVLMQVTPRGQRWDHAREAQRVHGVAATIQATAAKPAAAGMGMEGPSGAEPLPTSAHRKPPQTQGQGAQAGGMSKAQGEEGRRLFIDFN